MLACFNTWCIKDIRETKSGIEKKKKKKKKNEGPQFLNTRAQVAHEMFSLFQHLMTSTKFEL